jgi:thiol-disulfide isomerase/thioredoxin
MVALHSFVLALALTSNSDAVLLEFSADWCGPCREMQPVIQQLSAAGYPIRQVNIDQEQALASQHRVTAIPCCVLVADGKEIDRVVGATDARHLTAMFERAGIGRGGAGIGNRGSGIGNRGSEIGNSVADPFNRRSEQATLAVTSQPAALMPSVASQTPFSQTPLESPPATAAASVRERVMAASVRLKIQDPDGNSVGSGTIVDAREGEALVLTCGHVFRDSKGQGKITVDLFAPQRAEGIPARLIAYDLKSDVGLVSFRTTVPVTAARVAPVGHAIAAGNAVINIGCSHGAEPTARDSRIAGLDRFLGPPNLQVTGQPVQGRSGGGLFTADGLVIGVCNAADPSANEGLYAAMGSIHAALERANLSVIYQSPSPVKGADTLLASVTPPPMPASMPRSPAPQPASLIPDPSSFDLASAAARDAEVICIVRPHADPRAKSEIIVLDRATPGFLDWLATEQRTQSSRQMTSLHRPDGSGDRESGIGNREELASGAKTASATPTALRWLRPKTR